jgi:hypothetical protein
MDDRAYRAGIRHLRRVAEAIRLLDLDEMLDMAEEHGTDEECRLIAAIRTIADRLPNH